MTIQEVLTFWQTVAQDDWDTAQTLFTAKKYSHALFFCHLALEKLLKGLVYAKTKEHPLPIHDLRKLAAQSGVILSREQNEQLKEVTSWNINARYDDYKRQFYRKATNAFTTEWMGITKELFVWIKNHY